MRPALAVDPSSSIPLHRQIYEEWRRAILSGRFAVGERVPSTRDLAATLSVSRSTVTVAYEQLLAEGYLASRPGSGTFVSPDLPREPTGKRPTGGAAVSGTPPVRLSRYGASLREDFRYPEAGPGVVHFSLWRPDLAYFPFPLWRKLLGHHVRAGAPAIFDYAANAAGYEPLRREIATYVARSRAVHCKPEQVIIVNGSHQGLDLSARLLLEPGDTVAFEEPGYSGARRIFNAYGARIAPAAVDGHGIVPSAADRTARLIYVTPSHQFPTGVALSLGRRLELIESARRAGAIIVEDDYDSEYRYSGPPLPSLQGLAGGSTVVYAGTFSKVMFPALRIGFLVVPPQLASAFERAKWLADRQTPSLEQAALADFLRERHLDRHIRRMRRIYGHRREALIEALDRHFGSDVTVTGDPAGMHVLVRFHDPKVVAGAAANRVVLTASSAYYLGDGPAGECVIGFSAIGERTIREGVRRLASSAYSSRRAVTGLTAAARRAGA
jgi:GntR family transcriptional regulator/MocR family aminotransferase